MRPTVDHRELDDRELGTLLDDLPRERASTTFTAGVFDRLASRRRRTARRRRALSAIAATVALTAGSWGVHAHRQDLETQHELAAIRRDLHSVRQDLQRLERLERASRPVLYLGSTDEVDLVLDLNRLARHQQRHAGTATDDTLTARPAALTSTRRP